MFSKIDQDKYFNMLKAVASMSSLYSSQDSPLIHYRFIENLFTKTSLIKAELIAHKDMSFDCRLENKVGVGIKTFVSKSQNATEKIAEFNKISKNFKKHEHDPQELFVAVAKARNERILSDVKEYDVDLDKSFYHCLVRKPGGVYIHEEPYELIDIPKLKLIDKSTKYPVFSDEKSEYNYNSTKSTLLKRFKLNNHKNSKTIDIQIISEDKIYEALLSFYKSLKDDIFIKDKQEAFKFINFENDINANLFVDKTDEEFVILPLYGTRKYKFVEERSGINAWNAGGRERKFGESYIPIPSVIHKIKPNFFPPRDQKFRTKLPNGKIIKTKVSQEGSKAFQSDPLTDLCEWLFELIDLDQNTSKRRFQSKTVYTYDDLINVGKDAVKIIKVENKDYEYELHSMPIDSFESFVSEYEI